MRNHHFDPEYNQVEKLLIDYYKSHSTAATQIDEEKLESALLAGIAAGNSRHKHLAHSYPWKLAGAVLACCLILFGGWQAWELGKKDHPAFHASRMDIPSFVYDRMTPKLKEAARHGLYQPINETVTQGDYQVTVHGVLADRTEMVLFYTSVNLPGNTPIFPREPQFMDAGGKNIEAMIEYLPTENDTGTATNVHHGEFTLSFSKKDIPNQFNFSAKWGHPQASDNAHELINFPIRLDSSKYAGLEQKVEVNRTETIGPYTFTVTRALLNPLTTRVYVHIESAEENLYQGLIDPVLWITQGGARKSIPMQMSTTNVDSDQLLIQFDSLYYSDWQQLSFGASGMEEALGEDLELVLDTEKQELISSPNDSIRLDRIVPSEEFIDLYFELDFVSDQRSPQFNLDNEFTDGDGGEHSFIMGSSSSRRGQDTFQTINYKMKPGAYAQPLTFKLLSYPGTDIYQTFEVPLLSENNSKK
ncbi:DUF4179 domain-containing protein [Paenibacillus bouchesdurhonensis]|uniref:DUF4179 domain-containing protein n=1 Tax=Paenibacillus bouchesdurhonensis TaxID=1870990 RepID=UPI000DA62517|nr:DUF4179 domain-containing protein [Paenibacillus bouchesdurhonensis]